MTDDEIEDSIATLAYFSKGRFNPQWVESLGFKRKMFYTRWLRKQLIVEHKAMKEAMRKLKI